MAAFLAKRGLWLGTGFILLALACAALASVLAGTRISSAALDRELSELSGRRVVFSGEPVVRIFPTLTVNLRELELHDWVNSSDQFPVLKSPETQLTLSILAALQGRVEVTNIVLNQPQIWAKAESGNWQTPFGSQSRLAELISGLAQSQTQNRYEDDLASIQNNAPGIMVLSHGTVFFDRDEGLAITNVNANFTWQKNAKSGELTATGIWQNETAKVTFSTGDFSALLAGASTSISLGLESKPLTTRFEGAARLQPSPFVEGNVSSEIPSLTRASEWLGLKTLYPFSATGLTLNGALKAEADKWQLEESQLRWGTNTGLGGLIFQPKLTPPLLSGTLDFDVLDLAMLAEFFSQGRKPNESGSETAAPDIGTDLRISAQQASFGSFELNNVAASLQVSKLTNTLDIHNAAAFGGTLQMALKSQNSTDFKTELRILGSEIETKSLAALGGTFADLPQARGSISAILNGGQIRDADFLETAEGTVKMRLGAGTIPGLNANQIVKDLRKGGFFPLVAEAPSILTFSEITAEAALAQGALQFNPLRIVLDQATLNLSGAYSVKDRSIALGGTLDLDAGHPESPDSAESLKVFFGGNLDAPLMSGLEGNP